MKKLMMRLTPLVLVVFMVITSVQPAYATSTPSAKDIATAIDKGVWWLTAVQNQPDLLIDGQPTFWGIMIEKYGGYVKIDGGVNYTKYVTTLLEAEPYGWGMALANWTDPSNDKLIELPVPHSSAMDTSMAIIGLATGNETYPLSLAPWITEGANWLVANQNATDGYWEWEYIIAPLPPEWELQGRPNIPSTYMGVMGLIFAFPFVPPDFRSSLLANATKGLEWMIGAQNPTDGGWGFFPYYFPAPPQLVESDALTTAVVTSTLCLALQFGIKYVTGTDDRTIQEAIELGIDYVLDKQEKKGSWRRYKGSWYSQLMEMQGLDSRPYATTQSVICLIRFRTLIDLFPGYSRRQRRRRIYKIDQSIKNGIKWIAMHNLQRLDKLKPTRDVVDGLVVFESLVMYRHPFAGMMIDRYEEKLRDAVEWVLNAQGDRRTRRRYRRYRRYRRRANPLDWGWGPMMGLPDTIYDTGFAIPALAWYRLLQPFLDDDD